MTTALDAQELGKKLAEAVPGSVTSSDRSSITVDNAQLYKVAEYLKTSPGMHFDYLTFVTAVDYVDYFELVYRLVSLQNNQSIIVKTRCYTRDNPVVPSLTPLWRAAYYQEREIFDLFGIRFEGHPDLRRLLLWEGFHGYPLRRDYL
jgi:NADH-quinone oxidoreductase subunit C